MRENGTVFIENYEITACHGVNEEEKVNPQRFVVSARLEQDVTAAGISDNVVETTSYSAVCKRIKSFFLQKSVNLLEYLALNCARMIIEEFPLVKSAEVIVRKPDAPMKGIFDAVGVTARVRRSVVYLSMGSNIGDRQAYMDNAVRLLAADPLIFDVEESRRIETAPYGGVAKDVFVNSVLRIETAHTPYTLLGSLHNIESECGRVRKERWGDRTLDLDIIFFDDEIIDEGELIVPHADMANRIFVLEPLAELAPFKVHPVTRRRVVDMLNDLRGKA